VENVNLAILRDENKALREQLQFYTKYNYNKILVNIISKSISTDQRQVITIDAGELSGLKIGQPVIAGEGVIIGKLIEVREKLSYACVATDKNCHLAATVSGGEGLSGLTQGDLELTVNLDFVPQNQAIEISDVIITSGLEAEIPKGLIIGEVQDIKNEPNNLFKTAIINPAIDLNKINIVSVIIN
jgi:rod shape-determining protein MreC